MGDARRDMVKDNKNKSTWFSHVSYAQVQQEKHVITDLVESVPITYQIPPRHLKPTHYHINGDKTGNDSLIKCKTDK